MDQTDLLAFKNPVLFMDQEITYDAIIPYLPGIWAYLLKKKNNFFFQRQTLVINCPFLTREKYDLIIYKIYFYKLRIYFKMHYYVHFYSSYKSV